MKTLFFFLKKVVVQTQQHDYKNLVYGDIAMKEMLIDQQDMELNFKLWFYWLDTFKITKIISMISRGLEISKQIQFVYFL